MTLLGNSRRLLQFNDDAIRQLVIGAVKIGSNSLIPEFQLTVAGGTQPIFDCIVTKVTVSLVPNTPQVTIELEGPAVIALPGQEAVALGSGVQLQLLGTLQQNSTMSLQLTAFNYAGPFNSQTAAIPGFQPQVETALSSLVILNESIPLLTIPTPDPSDGATSFFINALDPVASSDGSSLIAHDLGDGTANCLLDGENIAIGLSAYWLIHNVLCQQLTDPPIDPLFGSISALPPICSMSGGPLKQTSQGQDIFIDSVDFNFVDGGIVVSGVFHCSGTCWSVTGGTFSYPMSLTLSSDGESVIPHLDSSSGPSYDLDVDFLCRAAVFAGGLIVRGLGFIAGMIVALFAGSLGAGLFAPNLKAPKTRQSAIPTLNNTRWTSLRITSEGLIIGGVLSMPESASSFFSNVVIAAAPPTYSNTGSFTDGSFTVNSPLCGNGTFKYSHALRDQVSTVTATCTGLLGRVTYSWSVNAVPLKIIVGTLQLLMTVSTAAPPPDGTPVPGHLTTVDWLWSTSFSPVNDSASLTLTSHAADLNYTLHIRLVATDQVGQVVTSDIAVNVVGDDLEFPDNSYENYVHNCLIAVEGLVFRTRTKPQGVPIGGDPGKGEKQRQLIASVIQSLSEGAKEGRIAFQALYALKGKDVLNQLAPPGQTSPTNAEV
jgi:hypothetical protein